MSSKNVELIISELGALRGEVISLRAQVSSLEAILSSKAAVKAAAVTDGGKASGKKTRTKNPDAPKREPNAWIMFAKRVRDPLKSNGYTEKAIGIECNQFASSLKDANADLASWSDEDILARRAAWNAPEASKWVAAHGPSTKRSKSGPAPTSVVSGGEDDGLGDAPVAPKKERKNHWAGLSEEERKAKSAKMAAARAAKAGKNTAVTVTEPVATNTTTTTTKVEDAPAPITNAAATNITVTTTAPAFRKASVRGSPYLVDVASGHAYHRMKDGSQGEWAGIFHREGFTEDNGPWIDDSVPEPVAPADDELIF